MAAFNVRCLYVLFLVGVSVMAVNSQSCGCDVKYTKIGCYHDPGSYVNRGHMRPLRILLLNWRDKINWTEGWNDHLKNIACRCADLASKGGYRYFGLQYYGECWSGKDSSDLLEGPKSDKCWGYRPDYPNCDDESSTECIGKAHYNYIYQVEGEGRSQCPIGTTESPTTMRPTKPANPCKPNPCRNGGECRIQNGRPICDCARGYLPPFCKYPI